MPAPKPLSERVQLLVEGNDQLNFFEALARHLQVSGIQVQNFGGVSELRGFVIALARLRGFNTLTSVGIVRDAETSAQGAFRSVQSSLRAARLPVPEALGTRVGDSPAVSALLLPGDDRPGMLETLLCDTIEGSPEAACIDDFLECLGHLDDARLRWADKRRARAFIATKPDPNLRVGEAAQRGYWDLDHPALEQVRRFVQAL